MEKRNILVLPNNEGGIVDDLIVYKVAWIITICLVVNASTLKKIGIGFLSTMI